MGTWRGDSDDAAAAFLAEHGMVQRFDGDELVIDAGNEALLPPWPPDAHTPPTEAEGAAGPDPRRSQAGGASLPPCAVCDTPVKLHGDAGWRHELGYRETGGCSTPWPAG